MPISGELSTYNVDSSKYPIFTSGDLSSTRCIAFIGGLGAGLGSVPYMSRLSDALGKIGWKLVQFHWSSAYDGYETGNLQRDVEEMNLLVQHLESQGMTDLVWMGNSTGCQDIACYLSTIRPIPPIVKGGILQAPVSDRESIENWDQTGSVSKEEAAALLDAARQAEGKTRKELEDIVPSLRKIMGGRLTYGRAHSLYAEGGYDDYFSSDLPSTPSDNDKDTHAHPLSDSFGNFTVPTLALWSENDQFAFKGVDTPEERMQKWAEAAGEELRWAVMKGADHEVTNEDAQDRMIDEVLGFLKRMKLI